ncbi:hypothetical protein OF001_U20094 [Pseudomonas sp. OF001]|nr:hypothetical protein OF001_U20094 [Pseudomonas sp. OF001]
MHHITEDNINFLRNLFFDTPYY